MLGDKQEAKFGGVMSVQNTHHIRVCEHVFGSFHLVISAAIVVYIILGFLCILGEKGGIRRLCGDLKRRLQESSASTSRGSKVATLRSYDTQPTLANIAMLRRRDVIGTLPARIFRYKNKNEKGSEEKEHSTRRRR